MSSQKWNTLLQCVGKPFMQIELHFILWFRLHKLLCLFQIMVLFLVWVRATAKNKRPFFLSPQYTVRALSQLQKLRNFLMQLSNAILHGFKFTCFLVCVDTLKKGKKSVFDCVFKTCFSSMNNLTDSCSTMHQKSTGFVFSINVPGLVQFP